MGKLPCKMGMVILAAPPRSCGVKEPPTAQHPAGCTGPGAAPGWPMLALRGSHPLQRLVPRAPRQQAAMGEGSAGVCLPEWRLRRLGCSDEVHCPPPLILQL